jgi:hypothetical protein
MLPQLQYHEYFRDQVIVAQLKEQKWLQVASRGPMHWQAFPVTVSILSQILIQVKYSVTVLKTSTFFSTSLQERLSDVHVIIKRACSM